MSRSRSYTRYQNRKNNSKNSSCSCWMCKNKRELYGPTRQELIKDDIQSFNPDSDKVEDWDYEMDGPFYDSW